MSAGEPRGGVRKPYSRNTINSGKGGHNRLGDTERKQELTGR